MTRLDHLVLRPAHTVTTKSSTRIAFRMTDLHPCKELRSDAADSKGRTTTFAFPLYRNNIWIGLPYTYGLAVVPYETSTKFTTPDPRPMYSKAVTSLALTQLDLYLLRSELTCAERFQ